MVSSSTPAWIHAATKPISGGPWLMGGGSPSAALWIAADQGAVDDAVAHAVELGTQQVEELQQPHALRHFLDQRGGERCTEERRRLRTQNLEHEGVLLDPLRNARQERAVDDQRQDGVATNAGLTRQP
jgi:hypothetical protein